MFTLCVNLPTLADATTNYVALPVTCRLVKADTALTTVLTTADSVITLSDGTTTIGTVTITQSGCAVGDVDHLTLDTTSLGKVELGPALPLKIVNDGGPAAGVANITLTFDEFHSDI